MTEEQYIATKEDESLRTFESRLLFIKEIFTNTYSEDEILKKCIEHKLKRSYEAYIAEVNRCFDTIINKVQQNPISVINKLK